MLADETQVPVLRRCAALGVLLAALVAGVPRHPVQATASAGGLHVQGNRLVTASGHPVRLLGVNRSGTEYACIQGHGIFDGPSDAASVQAMAAWHTNAVRVPLNEDCWLAINDAPAPYAGTAYRQAIAAYVHRLNQNGLAAILDLQWAAPGTTQARSLLPMPDQDHAPAFWSSVASYFRDNLAVLFDMYNEPYPDANQDTPAAWKCWRDGGRCRGVPYQVAGMQELVRAVRRTRARNVLLLGGVQYADTLSRWLAYRPHDPSGNLAAAWHVYRGQVCAALACWTATVAPVARRVPLVVSEIGENDCGHRFIDPLMAWLDRHGASYLAWAWNPYDCAGFPALIRDYSGRPTAYGAGYKAHLAALARAKAR